MANALIDTGATVSAISNDFVTKNNTLQTHLTSCN